MSEIRSAASQMRRFVLQKHIGFVIRYGEAVGIRGGSGTDASTLLKLLKRATLPSRGRIVLGGGVGSLLEVGMAALTPWEYMRPGERCGYWLLGIAVT